MIPRPPSRPQDYECCRRGCCPCIFDYYEDALARWDAQVRALGHDPDQVLGDSAAAVRARRPL